MNFLSKLWLAVEVLKRWEVLASIAAVILIGLLMGSIANPGDKKPRVVVPKARSAPKKTPEPSQAANDEDSEVDEPQSRETRRRAVLDDEAEE